MVRLRVKATSSCLLTMLAVVACTPAITPAPPPVPLPELPPVAAAPVRPVRVAITARHDTVRYDMVSESRLTRDSAGQAIEESVTLSARIALATERLAPREALVGAAPGAVTGGVTDAMTGGVTGAGGDARPGAFGGAGARPLRSTGRVDGFVIQSTARVAGARASARPGVALEPATPSLPLTVAFDAMLDGLSARVVPRPTLANECDRPEISALGMVRELLVRLPDSVAVGDRWADSARVFVCRGGVPVITQVVAQATVRALEDGPNGTATRVMINRTLATRVEGELVTAWRRVTLTGTGDGTQQVVVDAVTGVVEQLNGESTLTLTLRDSMREALRDPLRDPLQNTASDTVRPDDRGQVVTQRVKVAATRRPR